MGKRGCGSSCPARPCSKTLQPRRPAPGGSSSRNSAPRPTNIGWKGSRCGSSWAARSWFDALSLREAAGGPELLWEADVNRPVLGVYNAVDSFLVDELVEAAGRNGIYLQLCLLTRDLYMTSLGNEQSPEYARAIRQAKKFLRYAVARWGYSAHVAAWEYFNEIDPGLPTDRFYSALGAYLEEIDVYHHLRTTSTWSPSPKDWRHAKLDIAEMHHYLRPASGAVWKDEVAVLLERSRFLREHPAGPMLLGEFGLADDRWGLSPYMRQDRELVHFHNSLWASALSGAAGTALFWWWDQLDQQDAYRHYRPLASFLADLPSTTAGFGPTEIKVSGGARGPWPWAARSTRGSGSSIPRPHGGNRSSKRRPPQKAAA